MSATATGVASADAPPFGRCTSQSASLTAPLDRGASYGSSLKAPLYHQQSCMHIRNNTEERKTTMSKIIQTASDGGKSAHQASMIFPIGEPNDGFAQYFSGASYLAPVSTSQVGVFNVTFEPGCRNNWHIHHAEKGGGQILICVGGVGYYQEWGKEPVEMHPGDCINIPAGVKHWHGAGKDSWFSHLAIEVPGEGCSNEWLEPAPKAE